jgi:hypothetical protein
METAIPGGAFRRIRKSLTEANIVKPLVAG